MAERFAGEEIDEVIEAKIRNRFFDDRTYDFFKEKITELPADKPFFAVMATIETHFGQTLSHSQKLFPTEAENTIHHASYLAGSFLEWVREQPFGKNTTVVFIGDHLMMRVGGRKNPGSRRLFKKIPPDSRFIFNAFINTRRKAPDKERRFTQVDIFPTLVEALGYEIEGSRLGLGTSLFSKRKTLIEELGKTEMENELKKKNLLYDALWESKK
jgi:phosphoglycerol transferase